MDLQLYLRVLWRFRLLMAAGVVLAATLALLSYVRVGFPDGLASPRIEHREQEKWVSYATLFVTQQGFPWGYSVIQQGPPEPVREQTKDLAPQFADPNRFSSLAVLYSYLATSDPVRAIIRRDGPLGGKIEAAPVVNLESGYGVTLPLIRIAAISPSPLGARRLAQRTTSAFRVFLAEQQEASGIPRDSRVLVTVVKRAEPAELYEKRSITLPAVVFLAVGIAVTGLAFLLENLRPRTRAPAAVPDEPLASEPHALAPARKSA